MNEKKYRLCDGCKHTIGQLLASKQGKPATCLFHLCSVNPPCDLYDCFEYIYDRIKEMEEG